MTSTTDHPQRNKTTTADKPLPHIEPLPLWLVQHTLDVIEQAECGLPKNVRLEQETLCGILLGDDRYTGLAFATIEPEDFSSPVYAAIFAALKEGWEQGVPFNTPALLLQWVKDSKLIERVGEQAGLDQAQIGVLLEVMQSNGMAHNIGYYAKLLRRLRVEREIWILLMEAAVEAKEGNPRKWLTKYATRLTEMRDSCEEVEP